MTPSEYKELVELIGLRFDRTDTRTAALEDRLTRVELGNESLRDDLRAVAEQAVANSLKIEENGGRIERNGARIEENGTRIDALASRFGAFEVAMSTRVHHHEQRIGRLE